MNAVALSPAYSPWSSGLQGVYGLSAGEGQQIALQTVSSAGAIAAGTAPLWTQAAWAIPVIGAGVAGVALAVTAWFSRKGPKQKTATTGIANEIARMMDDNTAAYFTGPRTVSSQAQALATFDALWQALLENCGDPEMGKPGKRCIFERQRPGTCSTQQAQEADESLSDCGKYSMARDNRDPIANDPNVKADPIVDSAASDIGAAAQQLISGAIPSGKGLLLLGVAGLILFGVMAGGSK